jgi:NADH-quinone oxidoreductase subunit J
MTISDVIFLVVALLTVGSAAVVVWARSLIYSAFSLLFTFFGVAVLYAMLGADFLAATQVLIYIGGILILLLFGVMLTHRLYNLNLKTEVVQFLPGLLLAAGTFLLLGWIIVSTPWPAVSAREVAPTTARIGTGLLTQYLLPFEVASVLLLIALIGAAMLVRRRSDL